jgi:hypothetical protein
MNTNSRKEKSHSLGRYLLVLLLCLGTCLASYGSVFGKSESKAHQDSAVTTPQENVPRVQSQPSGGQSKPDVDAQEVSSADTNKSTPGAPDTALESDPAAPAPPDDEKVSVAEDELSGAEQWEQRLAQLVEGIQTGQKTNEDADKFYPEVSSALQTKRSQLRAIMRSWRKSSFDPATAITKPSVSEPSEDSAPTPDKGTEASEPTLASAETLYKEIITLYDMRVRLLQEITPPLWSQATGVEIEGVQELQGEIEQVVVGLRFQTLVSPNLGQRMISNFKQAPLPAVVVVLKLILVVVVFRLWRRWARGNIGRLHHNIIQAQSRKLLVRYSARFLWYADRLRSPLEWLILVWLLFQIIDPKYIQIIDDILFTQIRWFLLAWFCIAFVSAIVKRGAGGLKSETASLRLKSLWLAIGWLLLALLALNFAENLAGKGTVYEWVWMLFEILAVPVMLLLVSWWRPEVFRLLENEPLPPPWINSVLKDKTGVKSYKGALIGAGYLSLNWFRQRILRVVTSFEGGRALVASLTRMEATRASELQGERKDENPIPTELYERLLADDDHIVDSVAREELSVLVEHVSQGRSGAAVIISERGGGKSSLLKRVAMESGSKALFFNCPPGGYDAFYRAFMRALNLDEDDVLAENIGRHLEESGIRLVGVDNMHRLSRPVLGGQRDMDRLGELARGIQTNVLWVFGVDRAAWQYISRVRAHKMLLEETLDLPLWKESQIKELIEHRVAKAGIDIDYSRLVLPRQYDDIYFETPEERNRAGYYRVLWSVSDGNPVIALRLWVESLYVAADNNLVVRIPQLLSTKKLERLSINGLLVMRAIAQMGMAAQRDIIESLKLSETEIANALRFSINNGWIEETNGYYHITWKWYLGIRRVLARQNLLSRQTLGGAL